MSGCTAGLDCSWWTGLRNGLPAQYCLIKYKQDYCVEEWARYDLSLEKQKKKQGTLRRFWRPREALYLCIWAVSGEDVSDGQTCVLILTSSANFNLSHLSQSVNVYERDGIKTRLCINVDHLLQLVTLQRKPAKTQRHKKTNHSDLNQL